VLFAEFITHLSSARHNQKAVTIFCKAMLVFALVKILFIWNTSLTLVSYYEFATPGSLIGKIIFLPSVLANDHLNLIYIAFMAVLIILVILPWNYISGILFFWIIFNLYRLNIPVMNGSDNVQLVLACCMVFMTVRPYIKHSILSDLQATSFNAAVILAQLIVVCIYFISGWDKLLTESWRTGEAIAMIAQREQQVGVWGSAIVENALVNGMLSWTTIIFELAFAILIWFRRFRFPLLIMGVMFHLIIAFTLTLYDFSFVMIASYFIFLTDEDYTKMIRNLSVFA
jgi:hypothetical protein